MTYTRDEWRKIVNDEDFDEQACLVHKTDFAAIVRELLDENRDIQAERVAAVALAEHFIPTDKLEAYVAAKYPKTGGGAR